MPPQHPFNPFDFPPFESFPPELQKFFKGLTRNNNKEWFDAHKSDYEEFVKEPLTEFVAAMAREFREWAPDVIATPKRSIFRIYRDIRFSKDKTPYKTHAAVWFPMRDSELSGGFYMHISQKELLLGGGIWHPPSEYLLSMRKKLVHRYDEFEEIVTNKAFVKMFKGLEKDEMLRSVPRGFDAEHPAGEYLRMKNYLVGVTRPPEEAFKKNFFASVVKTYKQMQRFVEFVTVE
jgi:uncharacterized protein (TIGR02453 family)